MAVAMEGQSAPAACFEGGGQQVQDPSLLERGKLEHLREKTVLTVFYGIGRTHGDGEVAERGRVPV